MSPIIHELIVGGQIPVVSSLPFHCLWNLVCIYRHTFAPLQPPARSSHAVSNVPMVIYKWYWQIKLTDNEAARQTAPIGMKTVAITANTTTTCVHLYLSTSTNQATIGGCKIILPGLGLTVACKPEALAEWTLNLQPEQDVGHCLSSDKALNKI